MGSSSLTRDRTWVLCIGSWESQPLDHQRHSRRSNFKEEKVVVLVWDSKQGARGVFEAICSGIVKIGVSYLGEQSKLSTEIQVEGSSSRSRWRLKPWEGCSSSGRPHLAQEENVARTQLARLCASPSVPGVPDANTGKPTSSQIFKASWYPLGFSLNQAQGLPSRALAPFQSLASSGWEFSCQPLTRLPSPPSDLWPQQVASLLWVPFPRWAWGSFRRDQTRGTLCFDLRTTWEAPEGCSHAQPAVSNGLGSAGQERWPPYLSWPFCAPVNWSFSRTCFSKGV